MKAIKFSESELEFLQNHYELELYDAENYVSEIKNILKKLGVIEKEIIKEKPAKVKSKQRGRPKKEKNIAAEIIPAPVKPVKKAAPKKAAKKVKPVKAAKIKPVKEKAAEQKAEKIPVLKAAPKKIIKKAVKKAPSKRAPKVEQPAPVTAPVKAEAAKPE